MKLRINFRTLHPEGINKNAPIHTTGTASMHLHRNKHKTFTLYAYTHKVPQVGSMDFLASIETPLKLGWAVVSFTKSTAELLDLMGSPK